VNLFSAVTDQDMQTVRVVTGATMAAFLAVGLVPPLRPYVSRIRVVLLALFLVGCGGFTAYVLLR
jgi:uncharacterized membrane protein